MAEFKGVSEKFNLSLVHHDGRSERVVVQIGLDGLKITSSDSGRSLRSYELSHISRWQSRGTSLVLYTRTPSDVEERMTTLSGGESTVRSALDTLTCCCMQLAELLQSKQSDTAHETANNLAALVSGGGQTKKKSPALPSADDVEYWKKADKEGWLQCQGEHIKSWRNRWFVLKQGYLFRFYNEKVSASAKPRGVVDLSKVQDVKVVPGKGNMIQLKTSGGGVVQYMAATETEVVEWVSALEGAIQKICKEIAGVEDEPPPPRTSSKASGSASKSSTAAREAEWIKQLERNFESASSSHHHTSSSSQRPNAPLGNTMVSVLGYDAVSGGRDGGASSSSYHGSDNSSHRPMASTPYDALNRQYSGGYANIAATQIMGANTSSSDLDLNYGGFGGAGTGAPGRAPSGQLAGYGSGSMGGQPSYGAGYGAASTGGYAAPQQHQQQQVAPSTAYGQGYGYGQPQQVPQQQQPVVSLIDQVPQQQPAYPAYFQHASAPQPQTATVGPAPGGGAWQVHYTGEGRPYYYNPGTGITQWDPPAGM